jgi:hypothetical protein
MRRFPALQSARFGGGLKHALASLCPCLPELVSFGHGRRPASIAETIAAIDLCAMQYYVNGQNATNARIVLKDKSDKWRGRIAGVGENRRKGDIDLEKFALENLYFYYNI